MAHLLHYLCRMDSKNATPDALYGMMREDCLRKALAKTGGNVAAASPIVGKHVRTLWRWIAEFDIDRTEYVPTHLRHDS